MMAQRINVTDTLKGILRTLVERIRTFFHNEITVFFDIVFLELALEAVYFVTDENVLVHTWSVL